MSCVVKKSYTKTETIRFVKNKNFENTKIHFTKKGWSDVKNQTEVFAAIEAYQNTDKLNRIKHTHNLNASDS